MYPKQNQYNQDDTETTAEKVVVALLFVACISLVVLIGAV